MAEIQVRIEIQDSAGQALKRLILAVPEDITKKELFDGLRAHYPDLVDEHCSLLVAWSDNTPISSRLINDGAELIIRPRSSGVRILNEK